MTERELLDALARDVAEALTAIADREENWAGVVRSFASSIYDRHARTVAIPVWGVGPAATMADALHAHTARVAAEKDRAEAQQAVDDALAREGRAKAQYFAARDRADAAEATVRELRALCEEAAKVMEHDTLWGLWGGVQGQSIDDAEWKSARAMYNRLRAAAVQPASEGRADA